MFLSVFLFFFFIFFPTILNLGVAVALMLTVYSSRPSFRLTPPLAPARPLRHAGDQEEG